MGTAAAMTLEQGLTHVESIVGQEYAVLRNGAIAAAPGDVQQIAETLRFAQGHGFVVTPTTGGTKLDWGNPVEPGVLLSLDRLRAIREHAWQDMTCTVEAGCTWAAMETELAGRGQMVALDPLWPGRATVGGIVASNDSGAMRLRYGGLRDLIIGMTIVLADGTVAKTGGKVVKNVAGYDLHKLMTGSFGTLGVITEVNFRLHPAEKYAQNWTATSDTKTLEATAFAEPLRVLMDSQITPSCVQLRVAKQTCALDIRVAAVPECLRNHAARIRSIFAEFAVGESEDSVWEARQQLFDRDYIVKVSTLPSELCDVCAELQRWAATEGKDITAVGQATGLLSVGFNATADAAVALVKLLRARVAGSGGSAVVLKVADECRDRLDVWGFSSNALPLMREIKRRFDPGCILNPGRFVGGI